MGIDIKWEKLTLKQQKNKAKSNDKNKFRDKVPKILKGGEKGGKGKKKKWSKTKSKEKVNNTCFWTKPCWGKFLDVVAKETYLTPSIVSEKLKINFSLAREGIKQLTADGQIEASNGEFHSRMCN